jgi:hypothetical protein
MLFKILHTFTVLLLIGDLSMKKLVTVDAVRSAAIVGGGLGGLSCAINLLHVFDKLTIFDSADPGCGGASAASAGLVEIICKK